VIEPGLSLGETELKDLARALPLLQQAGAAVFAWPQTRQLDQTIDPALWTAVEVDLLRVSVVDNRLGEPGRRVEFELLQSTGEPLLLIDADGVVRGLARREADGRWLGWMRGAMSRSEVRVARLRAD